MKSHDGNQKAVVEASWIRKMYRCLSLTGMLAVALTLLGVIAAWVGPAIPLNAAQLAPTYQQAPEPIWPQEFWLYAGKITTFGFVVTQAGTVAVTVFFQGQPIAVTVQPWPAAGAPANATPTLPAAGSNNVVVTMNLSAAQVTQLGYLWMVTIAPQSTTGVGTTGSYGLPPVISTGTISIQHPPVNMSLAQGAVAHTLYTNWQQAHSAALASWSKVYGPFVPPQLALMDPALVGRTFTTVATNTISGAVRLGVNPTTIATGAIVGPSVPPNQPVSPVNTIVPVRSITGALPTTIAQATSAAQAVSATSAPAPSSPSAPAPPPTPAGVTLSGIRGGIAWNPASQQLECIQNLLSGWGWTFPGNCPNYSPQCPAPSCDWVVSQFDTLDIQGTGFQLGDQIHFSFGGQDFAAPCPTGWTCPWYDYTHPGSSGYVSPSEIVAAVPNIQGLPETVGTLYLQRGIQPTQNFGSLPIIFKPAQDVTLVLPPDIQVSSSYPAPAPWRDSAGADAYGYHVSHDATGIFVPEILATDTITATLPANSRKKIQSIQILQPNYSSTPADLSSFFAVWSSNVTPTTAQAVVSWVGGAGRAVDYFVLVTAVDTRGK